MTNLTTRQLAAMPLSATTRASLAAQGYGVTAGATGKGARVKQSDIAPYRSKAEVRFAELLRTRQALKEVAAWEYEPPRAKFVLAPRTTLTVDFVVRMAMYTPRLGEVEWSLPIECVTGEQEIYVEVKGAFVREDAWIKLKIAAAMNPDKVFVMAKWSKDGWAYKRIG